MLDRSWRSGGWPPAGRGPIGALLLDQRVLCGVGNVYRAEALFVNAIRPTRAG